jgi:hypothetical protein
MLHALLMMAAPMGRHRLQPRMQPDHVVTEGMRRVCQAAADLDSLTSLDQLS